MKVICIYSKSKYSFLLVISWFLCFFPSPVKAQDYSIKKFFNDELLTNFELNFNEDVPVHIGWCKLADVNKLNIPFRDTYIIWDTLRVNPYYFNLRNFSDSVSIDFTGVNNFKIPVKGPIKTNFGFGSDNFNYGIDISCLAGDSVLNSFDGIVRVAKQSKNNGGVVVVRNNNGLETVYSNIAAIYVKTNEYVKSGELLGTLRFPENNFFIKSLKRLSKTHEIPMSHVHWEIRYLGQAINPNHLIDIEKGCLKNTASFIINKTQFEYFNDIKKYIRELKKVKDKPTRFR